MWDCNSKVTSDSVNNKSVPQWGMHWGVTKCCLRGQVPGHSPERQRHSRHPVGILFYFLSTNTSLAPCFLSTFQASSWWWSLRTMRDEPALWTTEELTFHLFRLTPSHFLVEKFLLAQDDIPARLWMSSYGDLLPHRRVQKGWCANELPSYPCCQISDSPSSFPLPLNYKCDCFPAALQRAQSICSPGTPPEGKVLALSFKLSCLFSREEGRKYQPGHWCSQTELLKRGQHPSCHRTTQAVLLPALSRPTCACCHRVTSAATLLGSTAGVWACAPMPLSIHHPPWYLTPSKQYEI